MGATKKPEQLLDDASATPSGRPPGRSPSRATRLAGGVLILGLVVLIVGLAFQELRTRGTSAAGGITVANYRAMAKTEDRPVPQFEMPALSGTANLALRDYADKVVVLNFWATWCGPCRTEAPELESTWRAYRDRGVQFLGVNYRDDRARARAYEGEFGITYPSVFDPAGQLAFDYELVGLPTTFVIGRDGRIVYKFTGKIDSAILGRPSTTSCPGE